MLHMKYPLFQGLGIALVTPFAANGSIDFAALARIVDHQIAGKADYIVVLGTTAETPTLTAAEREAVKRFVADRVAGRVPLVLGLGGNSTHGVCQQVASEDLTGYSAILSVVPYYNKPQQEGIYRHFMAVAEASPLPVILYNVPGRTGVNMTAATTLRLAREQRNIIGIKEASGSLSQAEDILRNRTENFSVISGDDALTYPMMTQGASGVISVLANAFTEQWSAMVHACLEGRYNDALAIHNRYATLNTLLFKEGNPTGIKAALACMQLCENVLRLPSVAASEALQSEIERWV